MSSHARILNSRRVILEQARTGMMFATVDTHQPPTRFLASPSRLIAVLVVIFCGPIWAQQPLYGPALSPPGQAPANSPQGTVHYGVGHYAVDVPRDVIHASPLVYQHPQPGQGVVGATQQYVPVPGQTYVIPGQPAPGQAFPAQPPVQHHGGHYQNGQPYAAMPSSSVIGSHAAGAQVPVAPAQYTTEPRRTADSRILAMPSVENELQVIHHRSQLIVTRQPISRIAITDPAVIDIVQYSPTEIAVLGLGLGTTDMMIWFGEGEAPLMALVTVVRDPSLEERRRIDYGRIERYLAQLYPNSKVYLIPMSQKIIIRGQAADSQEAAHILQVVRGEIIAQDPTLSDFGTFAAGNDAYSGWNRNSLGDANGFGDLFSSFIINELQVPGEYTVMVRVRIAELNREQLRRFGLDWNIIFNDARHVIGQSFAAAVPVLTGIFENGEVAVLLDALASNGTMKIMEDSVVVTLSGRPAAFLSGGEFAVPTVVGINGVGAGTTTFRGFGNSIITTPTVIDRDLIRMQIIAELSSIANGNAVQGIPGTNVNRVQTQVELREGQTIVLGGLFSHQQGTEVTRIPLLGELPLIGSYFFHSKRATQDEKELLILLTPEFGRAMDPEEVPPMPGWYVTHPDDFDFYKYNRTEGDPDLGHYRLLPFGNGQGYAEDRGYNIYNPAPYDGQYMPQPSGQGQWGQTIQPPVPGYHSPYPPSNPYADPYASPITPGGTMYGPPGSQGPIYSAPPSAGNQTPYQPSMTPPPVTNHTSPGNPVRPANYSIQR